MWSEVPAVQVMAWRLLTRLSVNEVWAQDLLDTLFLEDEVQAWAEAEAKEANAVLKYIDCNGALLEAGDTVTLVKDLVVKGGGFTAKRGTAVRRILLDPKNAEHIEGRVNDQHIVILTKYVKKA
jgi:protein PhnA